MEKSNDITNENAVNIFVKSVEEKFSELIKIVEGKILENASNFENVSRFNLDGSDLSHNEQIKVLDVLKMYFAKKGFGVSEVYNQKGSAPYIVIEILIY